MGLAEAADLGARPAIALSGRLAGAIEDGGDRQIRHLAGQYADEIEGVGRHGPAGPADLVLFDAQSGVIAALPVDDEGQCVVHDVDDDLLDQQSDDLLTRLD